MTLYDISYIDDDILTAFAKGQSRTEPARDAWLEKNRHRLPAMRQIPATGMIRVKNHTITGDPFQPDFLVIRIDNAITKPQQIALNDAWLKLEESGAHYYPTRFSEDSRHRDPFPIFHLGRWKRQGMTKPRISQAVRQVATKDLKLRARRQEAVLEYMKVLDEILGKRVLQRLKSYDKGAVKRAGHVAGLLGSGEDKVDWEEVTEEVVSKVGGEPLRLGGLGTMVAVTRGQAEKYHLDPGDANYTLVIPTAPDGWGDDETDVEKMTGQMELPQLGMRIPVRPGQVLAFRPGTLLHRATEMREEDAHKRVVTTVFCDEQAGKWAFNTR